jgi:hypothetical protein
MLTVREIAFEASSHWLRVIRRWSSKGRIGTIGTPRGNLSRGSVHHSVGPLQSWQDTKTARGRSELSGLWCSRCPAGCVSHAAGFESEKMLLSCKRAVNLHHAWNATIFGTAICIRPLTMYTRSYGDVKERLRQLRSIYVCGQARDL